MTSFPDFYQVIQLLLLGAFAQFQPLTPADAGATFTYEVQAEDGDRHVLLGITVEEATRDDGAGEFVLAADYLEGISMEEPVRIALALDDTTRRAQQLEGGVLAEAVTLPPSREAATVGFGGDVPFRSLEPGSVHLPTAAGDTLEIDVRTFVYDTGGGEGLHVAVSPELGLVAVSLDHPDAAPIRARLRVSE